MPGTVESLGIPVIVPTGLHNLIPELLLHVATFLSQADLMKLTLTNKHIKTATEPELFREFVNRKEYGCSIKPFILRLLDQPHLAKHVRRVHLGAYSHIEYLIPDLEFCSEIEDCPKDDYRRLCEAAVQYGIIDEVSPFEPENSIRKKFTNPNFKKRFDTASKQDWYRYMYADNISIEEIPFEVQFCKLLHLGIDEPLVILLLALLPNVREIDIWGAPYHRYSLPWRAKHKFEALRCLKVSAIDDVREWSLQLFHNVLQGKTLQELLLHGVATEREHMIDDMPYTPCTISLAPRSTSITHLVLEHCDLERADMEIILQACAPIKSLYYSTRSEEYSLIDFTVQDMIEMLDYHKSSLRCLGLFMDVEWLIDENPMSSPSFREFSVLETLHTNSIIWADFLHGSPGDFKDPSPWATENIADHLPPSLKQLIIQESQNHIPNEDWNYRPLSSLIRQRNEKLLNFQDLVLVHIDDKLSQSRYEDLSAMVVRAAQSGFCFSLAARSQYRKRYPTLFAGAGDKSLYPVFGPPYIAFTASTRQE